MQAALDEDFLFLLYDVARTMRTRADQRARARGMTRAQWVILARLERQPGLTQNEMAAIVEVEPITIARLVDRLEARGLVVRKADPRDRRVWRLHLTPAAAPVLREIGKYRAELHDLITAGMTPSLQKALTDGLLQMKVNLAAEAPAAGKAGGATAATSSHDGGAARRERHA
jgi:MarR family transcriptional regulator, transcriptional regulator for hemolysin